MDKLIVIPPPRTTTEQMKKIDKELEKLSDLQVFVFPHGTEITLISDKC